MKGELSGCISQIVEIKRAARLTPGQNRYVDKAVRLALGLQLPRAAKKLPDFLSPAEIYHSLFIAWNLSQLDGLLTEFQIFTGLRIGETRSLQIPHIDFGNNQLKVVRGKGGKDRYVPVAPGLLNKLRMHVGQRRSGYVFCKENETPYTKRALQKRLEKVIRLCGFGKSIRVHDLRHTFACLMIAKGMRLEEIQVILGHGSRKTTEIYARLELGPVKEKYLQIMGAS